jgi:hypothetical protein
MDAFGSTDPKRMPGHFFAGAVHLDYPSAIPADIRNQNFSVAPRHWYLDADFQCAQCHQEFTWTAGEQKTWFEEYRFWIDAYPRHCKKCRAQIRHLENLRKEYDSSVADAKAHGILDQKRRIVEIIRELKDTLGSVPPRMNDHLELFESQLLKAANPCANYKLD